MSSLLAGLARAVAGELTAKTLLGYCQSFTKPYLVSSFLNFFLFSL